MKTIMRIVTTAASMVLITLCTGTAMADSPCTHENGTVACPDGVPQGSASVSYTANGIRWRTPSGDFINTVGFETQPYVAPMAVPTTNPDPGESASGETDTGGDSTTPSELWRQIALACNPPGASGIGIRRTTAERVTVDREMAARMMIAIESVILGVPLPKELDEDEFGVVYTELADGIRRALERADGRAPSPLFMFSPEKVTNQAEWNAVNLTRKNLSAVKSK